MVEPFYAPALLPPTPRRRAPAPSTAADAVVAEVQRDQDRTALEVIQTNDTEIAGETRETDITVDADWSIGRWLGRIMIFVSIRRRRP
jgi:hypothetical protein